MTWLSAIASALAILQALAEYLRDRKTIDDATAAAILKGLRDADDAINRAKSARDLVRADLSRDPDSILRDDDGFKRRDNERG
ncbi:MAG TPA: hypothetical protein VNQ99_04575 [Xanthobacteraceae bacterium]|nr:hypothetical protein [Xanthobacteraceae bacterium]